MAKLKDLVGQYAIKVNYDPQFEGAVKVIEADDDVVKLEYYDPKKDEIKEIIDFNQPPYNSNDWVGILEFIEKSDFIGEEIFERFEADSEEFSLLLYKLGNATISLDFSPHDGFFYYNLGYKAAEIFNIDETGRTLEEVLPSLYPDASEKKLQEYIDFLKNREEIFNQIYSAIVMCYTKNKEEILNDYELKLTKNMPN